MVLCAVLLSCGVADRTDPEPVPPLRVVFEADFLDVYGSITIEIEGQEDFVSLSSDGAPSDCASPHFVLRSSGPVAVKAWSEMGYRWETFISNRGEECAVVGIDTTSMVNSLAGVHVSGSSYEKCLPFEVRSGDVVGSISELWEYRPLIEQPGFEIADFLDYVLEAGRNGKAIVVAAEPFTEHDFEFSSATEDCEFTESVFVPDVGIPVVMAQPPILGE